MERDGMRKCVFFQYTGSHLLNTSGHFLWEKSYKTAKHTETKFRCLIHRSTLNLKQKSSGSFRAFTCLRGFLELKLRRIQYAKPVTSGHFQELNRHTS